MPAVRLVSATSSTFMGAMVVSDVRPVFAGEPPEPVAAMVIHTLKLQEQAPGGSTTSHFVALDVDDLRTMRGVMERALRKEEALAAQVRSSELTLIPLTIDREQT